MKKNLLLLSILMFLSVLSFSQGTANSNDSTAKKPAPPMDRNMFGLHVPRGLKINTPGIADGYIMFAVPNSPYIDLVNRKGEVVHQWKGNYNVFNAYLQDDGSIFQGALDPDFPTFGFGGPYERLQKVSWDSKMEYLNPYRGNITEPNGDPTQLMPMVYFAFRANFVAANNPGLANRKLDPLAPQPSPFILPPPPMAGNH